MNRNRIILLSCMLAGAVVGLVLMVVADQPQWERISTPPPVLVTLGNEDFDGIHAVDANGRWYNCPGNGPCTELAADSQPTQTAECPLSYVRPTPIPPLPIVSQRVYYLCAIYPLREDTIITSDGSLWRSAQNNGTDMPLFDVAYRIVFVAFWTIVGIVVYSVYRLSAKMRKLKAPTTAKQGDGRRQ